MLTESPRYRWQDHVITPRRASMNLKATTLIVAALVIAADLFADHRPDIAPAAAHAATTTERVPSLAQLAKRPIPPPEVAALSGC